MASGTGSLVDTEQLVSAVTSLPPMWEVFMDVCLEWEQIMKNVVLCCWIFFQLQTTADSDGLQKSARGGGPIAADGRRVACSAWRSHSGWGDHCGHPHRAPQGPRHLVPPLLFLFKLLLPRTGGSHLLHQGVFNGFTSCHEPVNPPVTSVCFGSFRPETGSQLEIWKMPGIMASTPAASTYFPQPCLFCVSLVSFLCYSSAPVRPGTCMMCTAHTDTTSVTDCLYLWFSDVRCLSGLSLFNLWLFVSD